MRLVADAPLPKRNVAGVIGPHLRRLDLQALTQAYPVEFFDVQEWFAATYQPGPVVESAAAQLQPDEHAGGRGGIPAPPPPGLDRHIWMTALVGGSEQHLDPAD